MTKINTTALDFVRALKNRFLPSVNLSDPNKPMRAAFLSRLAIYASLAFVASLALSFAVETRTFRREVQQIIDARFNEEFERAQNAKQTYQALERQSKRQAVLVARSIANHLAMNPNLAEEWIKDPKLVEDMAKMLNVGEICIASDEGIIVASYPTSSLGFDYKTSRYAKEFLQILDDPDLVITQPIRQSEGTNHQDYQYTGVARLDAPGFVEIGVDASHIIDLYKLADFSRYVDPHIGVDGFLAIFFNGKQVVGDPLPSDVSFTENKSEVINIGGRKYFTYAERNDQFLFFGGIPRAAIFRERVVVFTMLTLANFIVFFLVFIFISHLVQRLFVSGVDAINESLEKITNGDLSERVNVNSTKEFVELSAGVNATVDSLKKAAQEVERKAREEMALAQRIQAATQPNLLELYADEKDFDVYAENHPKADVGGDLFDFFFVDDNRLLFYVADVAGSGVPAALIMMKTAALVKNLAMDYELDEVVTLVNRHLYSNVDAPIVCGFFCMLDLVNGNVQYVNAGHISPFIKKGDGDFTLFDSNVSLILGGAPDTKYVASTLQLEPGDAVALCTDGFAVAFASDFVDSSDIKKNIGAIFNSVPKDANAKTYVDTIYSEMEKVTGSPTPLDDETALVFRFLQYRSR
ncbi:MAG: SpoIIE family protein phosphatase [Thermoguttaceae bacterium]|nr:SpoIIE family protein phosphatase [Thermoguttaceae bacterium]